MKEFFIYGLNVYVIPWNQYKNGINHGHLWLHLLGSKSNVKLGKYLFKIQNIYITIQCIFFLFQIIRTIFLQFELQLRVTTNPKRGIKCPFKRWCTRHANQTSSLFLGFVTKLDRSYIIL